MILTLKSFHYSSTTSPSKFCMFLVWLLWLYISWNYDHSRELTDVTVFWDTLIWLQTQPGWDYIIYYAWRLNAFRKYTALSPSFKDTVPHNLQKKKKQQKHWEPNCNKLSYTASPMVTWRDARRTPGISKNYCATTVMENKEMSVWLREGIHKTEILLV